MIENISIPNQHDAILRSSFRILQHIKIPEHLKAKTFDMAIDFICNEKNAIAIRAFAITTAFNVAKKYPELTEELAMIITPLLEHESPGLRNRSGKIISQINKLRALNKF